MKAIFKPKNQKVYVPGHGVIDKADFTETHLKACVRQVEAAGLDVEEYLKKHMEVSGYKDLPLFSDDQAATGKPDGFGVNPVGDDDEAELKRLIAEEEKAKGNDPATQGE